MDPELVRQISREEHDQTKEKLTLHESRLEELEKARKEDVENLCQLDRKTGDTVEKVHEDLNELWKEVEAMKGSKESQERVSPTDVASSTPEQSPPEEGLLRREETATSAPDQVSYSLTEPSPAFKNQNIEDARHRLSQEWLKIRQGQVVEVCNPPEDTSREDLNEAILLLNDRWNDFVEALSRELQAGGFQKDVINGEVSRYEKETDKEYYEHRWVFEDALDRMEERLERQEKPSPQWGETHNGSPTVRKEETFSGQTDQSGPRSGEDVRKSMEQQTQENGSAVYTVAGGENCSQNQSFQRVPQNYRRNNCGPPNQSREGPRYEEGCPNPGNYDQRGYNNQQGNCNRRGYREQQGYRDRQGYRNRQGYDDQRGYCEQQGYHDQQGYRDRQGYHDQQGYRGRQSYQDQGYYAEQGYHGPPRSQ